MVDKESLENKLRKLGYWLSDDICYDNFNNRKKYSVGFIGSISIRETFNTLDEIEEWIKSHK